MIKAIDPQVDRLPHALIGDLTVGRALAPREIGIDSRRLSAVGHTRRAEPRTPTFGMLEISGAHGGLGAHQILQMRGATGRRYGIERHLAQSKKRAVQVELCDPGVDCAVIGGICRIDERASSGAVAARRGVACPVG
jgi:hypothetical protein